jgi:arginase
VLEVADWAAAAVAAARADGDVVVLLGGDCTLVLGAVAGLRRQEQASSEVGVFYLDGDADLDTQQEGWGVLDSCGVAHLLGDGDPQLAALRPGAPLLDAALPRDAVASSKSDGDGRDSDSRAPAGRAGPAGGDHGRSGR